MVRSQASRFQGRRIVVIGGGNGIGLTVVRALLHEGARLYVADRDPEAPGRIGTTEPETFFSVVDATDEGDVERVFSEAAKALGGIDGALTTVGGSVPRPFGEVDLAFWQGQIASNLTSAFLVAKAALPRIAEAGGGALLLTSSGFSLKPDPNRLAYVASKAAVNAMTRSLALEGGPGRVRVNAVAPGPTATERFARHGAEKIEQMRVEMPMGEIPVPQDIADTMTFLLSDQARQITGQVIHVNGGLVLP